MAVLRWTHLLLTVLLNASGSMAQFPVTQVSVVVRDADPVVLDCLNMTGVREACPNWTFNESLDPMLLTDRVTLTPSCSLHIREVTVQDAGVYTCRSQNQNWTKILLSVLSIVECKSHRFVAVECHVTGPPPHTLRWEGMECEEGVVTRQAERFASASFSTAHPVHATRAYESWRCHLTDNITAKEHWFIYNPPYPGYKYTTTPAAKTTKPPATTMTEGSSSVGWIMVVLRVIEILLLSVMTVLLCRTSGRRRAAGGEHTASTPMRITGAAANQSLNRDGQEIPANYENV